MSQMICGPAHSKNPPCFLSVMSHHGSSLWLDHKVPFVILCLELHSISFSCSRTYTTIVPGSTQRVLNKDL